MHEMNDGLRPHYDFDFDEAIQRIETSVDLDPMHEEALRRISTGKSEPEKLAIGQELVIPQ